MGLGTSTGNRIAVKIRGVAIALLQNVSFDDDFGQQDVDGIGDPETQEFVAGKFTHRISGEKYMVKADTLKKLGFIPKSADWLTAEEMTVEVIDTPTGKTVEMYVGCKFNTHSRRYGKHQITGENFAIFARHKDV